jgi:hypothetical protein
MKYVLILMVIILSGCNSGNDWSEDDAGDAAWDAAYAYCLRTTNLGSKCEGWADANMGGFYE